MPMTMGASDTWSNLITKSNFTRGNFSTLLLGTRKIFVGFGTSAFNHIVTTSELVGEIEGRRGRYLDVVDLQFESF